MIIDESKLIEEMGEDPKKKENRDLYQELLRLGVEKDLEFIEELHDPSIVKSNIDEELERTKNTWSQAFATRAGVLRSCLATIMNIMEQSVDENLKNETFQALQTILSQHEREVSEIVEVSRKKEEIRDDEKSALIRCLSSQALQFKMDVKNILQHLLQ